VGAGSAELFVGAGPVALAGELDEGVIVVVVDVATVVVVVVL
jgi:hypothetical protein